MRNVDTRKRRTELVTALIDELLQFSAELRGLTPGWSQTSHCALSEAQKHWLDPRGASEAAQASGRPIPTDTAEFVSRDFANWLNAKLRDPLPMGDREFAEWRMLLLDEIEAEGWENDHDD